jgi:putative ABC transport system permease protein
MWLYQLRIAWKSARRNPGHTALVLAGIAVGVAVSTLFAATRHSFARDPIPEKSGVLHYVRMDNWDPLRSYPGEVPRPPTQITYRDMNAIMKSKIPVRQAGMFKASLYVYPDPQVGRPTRELVRMTFADFFPMFDVPFKYGGGWDRRADEGPERVVVISEEVNDRLFGGGDSVGKTVRIDTGEFRVVGVMARWRPSVKFYDVTQQWFSAPEGIFMPFHLVRPMGIRTAGNSDGWKSPPAPGPEGFLASETCWIQMWVELPDAAAVAAYQSFLDSYVREEKKAGRFERPLDNRVTPLRAWLTEQKVVPGQATALFIVSLLFLGVCSLNLMGLLLGKFLARAPEIGVRRALGARRRDIFVQHLLECELVALSGGGLGLLLSIGGLEVINGWSKGVFGRSDLFGADLTMAGFAVAAALVAGLLAGVYPAYRVCRLPPALHLKLQ